MIFEKFSQNEKRAVKDSPFYFGRSTRIRTLDPLVPNQVRYRAAPHSEDVKSYSIRAYRSIRNRVLKRKRLDCVFLRGKRYLVRNTPRHCVRNIRTFRLNHYSDQWLGTGGTDQHSS